MAAPKGNKFWEIRSRHGRGKLFATPTLLWKAATEYFEWCELNPLIEIDFKGKDADRVELPRMRPFTLYGLCLYCDCSTSYFRTFKCNLKKGKKGQDFLTVLNKIEEIIYNQKFSGAAAGFFNANIIARDLGLKDSSDVTVTKVGKDLADEEYK